MVSSATRSYINSQWNRLPSNVRDAFEVSKWSIVIENYRGQYYGGRYYPQDRKITITDGIYPITALYHEIGHFVDTVGNGKYFSSSSTFAEIYAAESANFVVDDTYNKGYYTSAIQEYFAESFGQYIYYPQRLLNNSPRTYEYIANAAASVSRYSPMVVYWSSR